MLKIKKLYIKSFIYLIVLFNLSSANAEILTMKGKVKIDIVNIREKPESDANIIFSIKKE